MKRAPGQCSTTCSRDWELVPSPGRCLCTLSLMLKALGSCWNWIHGEELKSWPLMSAGANRIEAITVKSKTDSLCAASIPLLHGAVYPIDNSILIQSRGFHTDLSALPEKVSIAIQMHCTSSSVLRSSIVT